MHFNCNKLLVGLTPLMRETGPPYETMTCLLAFFILIWVEDQQVALLVTRRNYLLQKGHFRKAIWLLRRE